MTNHEISELERERDDLRYRMRQRNDAIEADIRRIALQSEILTLKRMLGDLPLELGR